MRDLIKRIEAAEGPSRELDCDIFKAIGAPLPDNFASYPLSLTFDEGAHCYFMELDEGRIRYTTPAYTSSIDAAMTLVPNGPDWIITQDGDEWLISVNGHTSRSKSFALALCAAALGAKMAENEG